MPKGPLDSLPDQPGMCPGPLCSEPLMRRAAYALSPLMC